MRTRLVILVFSFLLILPGTAAQAGISDSGEFGAPNVTWYDPEGGTDHQNEGYSAGDSSYWFRPEPVDVYGLDHYKIYAWNVPWEIPQDQVITGAELRFNNIRNWDANAHDMYVNLLDDLKNLGSLFPGRVLRGGDNDTTNSFDNSYYDLKYFTNHELLVHYNQDDFTDTAVDISYTFGDSLDTLIAYLANNQFGIGLDPDCHYYNDGVYLRITTGPSSSGGGGGSPTPEPGSLFLLGAGMISLAGWQRRRQG